jgi:hypothetical protein
VTQILAAISSDPSGLPAFQRWRRSFQSGERSFQSDQVLPAIQHSKNNSYFILQKYLKMFFRAGWLNFMTTTPGLNF